jgi:hypothetical protein
MEPTIVSFLDSVKQYAFTLSLWAFVAINGVAVAALLASRSRSLVQRYTSPWLAVNILLLGTGAGVPLLAGVCKSVVQVVGQSVTAQPAQAAIE